jgi:hypothetical protein
MSAWTITALTGLKDTLEANARLSLYVDSVSITDRHRTDEVPAMRRHAIVLIPGALTVQPRTPGSNLELFTVTVRLVIRVWDVENPDEVVTSNSVTGGVGASEVGMLQFVEDVANALRKVELSILEMTGVECDGMPTLTQVASDERDTLFYETALTWTGQHKGYHDPTLRS